jgi:hypothetical protein
VRRFLEFYDGDLVLVVWNGAVWVRGRERRLGVTQLAAARDGRGRKAGSPSGLAIALLSFVSTVRLENSELVAQNAGAGGDGAQGQLGQTEVGFGGNGGGGGACPGGTGGLGGKGGAGGGGAGGISVGILWSGDDEPVRSGGMITVGTAGSAGIGGDPGNNDGISGVAEQVLQVP